MTTEIKRKKYAQHRPSVVISCLKCGKDFKKNASEKDKYCSRECYLARHVYIIDGVKSRRCTVCKDIKPLNINYFNKRKSTINGYEGYCKECKAKKHREWMKKPTSRALIQATKTRNIEQIKAYRLAHKSARNKLEMQMKKTNPSFALKNRVRVLMYHSLRHIKNGRKWQDLTGYSIDDLRCHIEKQFKDGMNWDLFMSGNIHIDHIIPVSAFNYTHPEDIDFRKCWSLRNLRPMWAKDNLKKSDKLSRPFQPSLSISMGGRGLSAFGG